MFSVTPSTCLCLESQVFHLPVCGSLRNHSMNIYMFRLDVHVQNQIAGPLRLLLKWNGIHIHD